MIATFILAAVAMCSADDAPRIDGRFDEDVWENVEWQSGEGASFAFAATERSIIVGVKANDAEKPVDVCMCPDGTTFNIYRFRVDKKGAVEAAYYSEGGNIQPDPFGPAWRAAAVSSGKGYTAELEMPFNAFYMTRNAKWSKSWPVKVGVDIFTGGKFDAAKNFTKVKDFPARPAGYNTTVLTALAEVTGRTADGKLSGILSLDIFARGTGKYVINDVTKDLRQEMNKVKIPAVFNGKGVERMRLTVEDPATGVTFLRTYPVIVDYQPVAVKLTTPCYRNCFYPGQDAAKVRGNVKSIDNDDLTLTLEGEGFSKRSVTVKGGSGEFEFDTTGFKQGTEAWLTATGRSGNAPYRMRIRNLAPTGHRMLWIDNGHLVLNGTNIFRRNIYAENYRAGQRMKERYQKDYDTFRITTEIGSGTVNLAPDALIKDLEQQEAKLDRKPSDRVFKRIDEILAKNKDRDYSCYYLCDEPECRNISPVYLKYIYDYVAERDPYHPLFSATRGGKRYIECVDWVETHPYLNVTHEEDGTRTYGTHPRQVGDFLDAFECADRPEKCVGFLPTLFAYAWSSPRNDYPTLDEYLAHCWVALMHGAKTMWPYAGHDIGDRPALYHGCRYQFRQCEVLAPFFLEGKRTILKSDKNEEAAEWTWNGKVLRSHVDFRTMKTKLEMPEEFAAQMESYESVAARVDKEEYARTHRDNQLLGRVEDIVVDCKFGGVGNFGGGAYKVFDGTLDMLAKNSSWTTNAVFEMAFTKFTVTFDRLLLHGWFDKNIGEPRVEIRKGGMWVTLPNKEFVKDDWLWTLKFDQVYSTVKMRISFPGRLNQRNEFELYEIELPYVKGAKAKKAKKYPKRVDEGVSWEWCATNCAWQSAWSGTKFYGGETNPITVNPNGTFTVKPKGWTRYADFKPGDKFLIWDFRSFENLTQSGYRAWFLAGYGSTVTYPQPGLYTFELPAYTNKVHTHIGFASYGIAYEFGSFRCVQKPAAFARITGEKGAKAIAPGSKVRIAVQFDEPCQDVVCELLTNPSTGCLLPYAINGASTVELRQLDEDGYRWGAAIKAEKFRKAGPRSVWIKVTPLGSAEARPIFGNNLLPFVETRED